MATNDLSGLKIDARSGSLPPGRWRQGLGAGIGAALVAAGLVFSCNRPLVVESVTVSFLYPSQSLTLLNASGYVVAQRKAAVAAQGTGRLVWLGVEEGSRVTSGQVLARLEDREARALLDQAQASLLSARAAREEAAAAADDAARNQGRQQQLLGQGYISPAEADVATTRLEQSRAAVARTTANIAVAQAIVRGAEVALDNTRIRAPFDAVVLTKNADLGDIVTPLGAAANAKSAVVSIADLSSLQVEADVSESNLSRIHPGQPCEIVLDALPDRRFRGELVTIVPTADRSKATVQVKVRFRDLDPRILPEMSARVAILERTLTAAEEAPRLVIPSEVLRKEDGRTLVFRLENGRAREVAVVLGPPLGDQIEVRSGLSVGDQLILRPGEKLQDGRRVKPASP